MNIQKEILTAANQKDKQKHFVAGILFGVAGVLVASDYSPIGKIMFGCLAASAVGVGKEVYDKQSNQHIYKAKKHGVEWQDAAATSLGGVVGALSAAVLISTLS